jgi:hypothetical protein
MHRSILAIAASTALIFSGSSYAMQRGHGGGKPTTTTTHGKSGSTTHGQSGSHAPSTKPAGGGAATHGGGKSHASGAGTTHAAGGNGKAKAGKTTTATTTTASPNVTTTTTNSTTTLTPVQQKLQRNTKLAEKLSSRLPEGTDLMTASEGFRNLGQFVAAVNVSNNLPDVKFTDLKTRMVDEGMSLGQALQDVKTTANVETEVRRAEQQADTLIKSTENSTVSTDTKKTEKPKSKPRLSGEDK